MTVIEAMEILKGYLLDPDANKDKVNWDRVGLPPVDDSMDEEEDGDSGSIGFDGAYNEYDEGYSFAIFAVDSDKENKEVTYFFYVDKITGKISWADVPFRPYNSFKKKINAEWVIAA
ncbi:hypothetical protein FACS1894187_19840 [Synergistales bacterium]|nr:hypothetical protein FACS1894187_19840 [Synergistales bacterium]